MNDESEYATTAVWNRVAKLEAKVERLKEAIIHIQTHLMLTHGFPCSKTESRCQLCDGVKRIIDEALKGGGE